MRRDEIQRPIILNPALVSFHPFPYLNPIPKLATQEYLALVIPNINPDQDMDLQKHGDSDASKQEEEKANDDVDNTGVGRSYECTFCKRGFTNAQALGGHMNIHRKDKAKAKQKNQLETSNKSKENHSNPRFMQQASSTDPHQQIGYQRAQMNYQVYLPASNPSSQTGTYPPLSRPDRFNDEANLCLRMGASPPADGHGGGEGGVVDSNVDLELRLGHDK